MREILCSGQAQSLEFPYPGGMAALCWSPAGERADGNAPLHLLLAGECGRFRFRDELGTDLDITWSDGAVHIEGDYRFLLTWEVLPVEEC